MIFLSHEPSQYPYASLCLRKKLASHISTHLWFIFAHYPVQKCCAHTQEAYDGGYPLGIGSSMVVVGINAILLNASFRKVLFVISIIIFSFSQLPKLPNQSSSIFFWATMLLRLLLFSAVAISALNTGPRIASFPVNDSDSMILPSTSAASSWVSPFLIASD